VGAHADSALVTTDGVSAVALGPASRATERTSVLEDVTWRGGHDFLGLAKGSVYCYPNPTHGDEIGVAYTLGTGVTEVIIRVLDPTGKEVLRVNPAPNPAENVARLGLQKLASGVYLVRVEARRGGTTDVAFQKFAVVR
jgi:hypothetical protein